MKRLGKTTIVSGGLVVIALSGATHLIWTPEALEDSPVLPGFLLLVAAVWALSGGSLRASLYAVALCFLGAVLVPAALFAAPNIHGANQYLLWLFPFEALLALIGMFAGRSARSVDPKAGSGRSAAQAGSSD